MIDIQMKRTSNAKKDRLRYLYKDEPFVMENGLNDELYAPSEKFTITLEFRCKQKQGVTKRQVINYLSFMERTCMQDEKLICATIKNVKSSRGWKEC